MANFFTADPHFCHGGMLSELNCARPFRDVEHMNETMVARWNETVAPGDDVWVIGDFAHRAGKARLEAIFERLAGHKRLIPGNHDHKVVLRLPWTEILPNNHEVADGDETFVLNHYPMVTWNKKRHGYRHLYGHVHAVMPGTSQSLDVGVDAWDFRPVSTGRILAMMARLPVVDPIEGSPRVSFAEALDEDAGYEGPRF